MALLSHFSPIDGRQKCAISLLWARLSQLPHGARAIGLGAFAPHLIAHSHIASTLLAGRVIELGGFFSAVGPFGHG